MMPPCLYPSSLFIAYGTWSGVAVKQLSSLRCSRALIMVHATPTGAYHLLPEPPLSFRGALATRNLGLRHPSNARSPPSSPPLLLTPAPGGFTNPPTAAGSPHPGLPRFLPPGSTALRFAACLTTNGPFVPVPSELSSAPSSDRRHQPGPHSCSGRVHRSAHCRRQPAPSPSYGVPLSVASPSEPNGAWPAKVAHRAPSHASLRTQTELTRMAARVTK